MAEDLHRSQSALQALSGAMATLNQAPAELTGSERLRSLIPALPSAAYPQVRVLPAHLTCGSDILHDPVFNKGTGFPLAERDRLGIRGLLPPRVLDIEQQAVKVKEEVMKKATNMDKWLAMQALQDRNETLFYKVLVDNIEEMASIIYTPTVGEACLTYSRNFRRARGMYFSADDRQNMHAMAYNWPVDRVDVVVITDGSRILGLGDLGVQGMGIPVGKLDLYVAGGGIDPRFVMPVMLDVGTNNEALLADPYYLGLQRPRLTGADYDATVDEVIEALHSRFPHALLQFEDFSSDHAAILLERYRYTKPVFNDDVQGTAAVVLGAVIGALAVQSLPPSAICDQRFLICGAGSAGLGVACVLRGAMMHHGLSEQEACRRFAIMDVGGLIGGGRSCADPTVLSFRRDDLQDGLLLVDAIETFKPTALLGLSTVAGLFSEKALTAMGQLNTRPLIFPLSNPTSRAECTAEAAAKHTGGRCIFAAGSPFADVVMDGKRITANQCNNMFVFPGLGLGVVISGAEHVSDSMLQAAAEALPKLLSPSDLADSRIFPRIPDIRKVSTYVAAAVVRAASLGGLVRNREARALLAAGVSDAELRDWAASHMYTPSYEPLVIPPRI